LIQRSNLRKPAVQAFLEVLRSEKFKKELKQRLPGLTPTEETGKIIYPRSTTRVRMCSFQRIEDIADSHPLPIDII
jgi:hypothetical protein